MLCQGYLRGKHQVSTLHAKGLCDACYQRKYQHDHHEEIVKYQQAYRADPAYAEMNRLYVRIYRKRH